MRNALFKIMVPLSLAILGASALAQATATAAAASAATAPRLIEPTGSTRLAGREQLTERIVVEDSGARISELRIGGETRAITVQPKGGLPAYDVRPISGGDAQGTSGARTWKIFGF